MAGQNPGVRINLLVLEKFYPLPYHLIPLQRTGKYIQRQKFELLNEVGFRQEFD
jgi:hypothetical protein